MTKLLAIFILGQAKNTNGVNFVLFMYVLCWDEMSYAKIQYDQL